jgi:hypothetical protein
MWSTTTRTRLKTTVLLAVCAAGSMLGCDRDSTARGPAAATPRVMDHPLLHLGRNGHLAGPPVAVAGVRCFRQIPRPRREDAEPRVEWFYCIADVDMNISEPRSPPLERAVIKVASASVTVHPAETERHGADADAQIWTVRRVDVAGATVKILATEFLGRPGHRIGYVMSADGLGGTYGRTVFVLHDPKTKEYIGAFCVLVERFR